MLNPSFPVDCLLLIPVLAAHDPPSYHTTADTAINCSHSDLSITLTQDTSKTMARSSFAEQAKATKRKGK